MSYNFKFKNSSSMKKSTKIVAYTAAIIIMSILLIFVTLIDSLPSQNSTKFLNIKCINGVEYYFSKESSVFYRGYGFMSPKFNSDGAIAKCNDEQRIIE